uniref:Uncharacterized protein n=1 Tax=Gopherus agassizii TaxID=38772 RepID=A0A452IN24_9SAUR
MLSHIHPHHPAPVSSTLCPYLEDHALWPLSDERPPGTLLHSLLYALQRPGRSPSFLFQPQRFARETRGSWGGEGRLSQRGWDSMASQFWSMAVPQRFGKKK